MENKNTARKIGVLLTIGIVSIAILYYLLFFIFFLSGLRIQRVYKGKIRELGIRIEMKVIKTPTDDYIEGREYCGIIILSKMHHKNAPADTIIVGLWPDSPFTLSLAINKDNEEMVLYDNYKAFPVLTTSNHFRFTKETRYEVFFNEPYFKKHKNPLNGRDDIFIVNAEAYIIVKFDTHIRNNGFSIYSEPGEVVYAPWPFHTARTERRLNKMINKIEKQTK